MLNSFRLNYIQFKEFKILWGPGARGRIIQRPTVNWNTKGVNVPWSTWSTHSLYDLFFSCSFIAWHCCRDFVRYLQVSGQIPLHQKGYSASWFQRSMQCHLSLYCVMYLGTLLFGMQCNFFISLLWFLFSDAAGNEHSLLKFQ